MEVLVMNDDIDTIIEDYERFLNESYRRWKKVPIDVESVRDMANWIEKRENLDMVAKVLRDLCAIVDRHKNKEEA
jgi:hypothetical protein